MGQGEWTAPTTLPKPQTPSPCDAASGPVSQTHGSRESSKPDSRSNLTLCCPERVTRCQGLEKLSLNVESTCGVVLCISHTTGPRTPAVWLVSLMGSLGRRPYSTQQALVDVNVHRKNRTMLFTAATIPTCYHWRSTRAHSACSTERQTTGKAVVHSRDPSHTSFEGFPRTFNVAPTTCPSGPHPFSPPTASCPCMSTLSYHCPTRLHSWQSRRRPCPGHSSGSPQTHPVSRRP